MKQFILMMGVVAITLPAVAQKKKSTKTTVRKSVTTEITGGALTTALDSFSYALGMNIANNLKMQNIETINNNMMLKAMEDVFAKRTPLLMEQQANMCIQSALQANASKKADAEKSRSARFLADNKKRPGVTTLPSGLQYEVLKKGDAASAMPKLQDTVVAHYAGTLVDGKEFDNSYKRGEPLTIPVGGVIKGWTEALQLMHVGDKWKVYIPSELGYGDRGAGADIPGGAALVFEMELLSIKPAASVMPDKEVPPVQVIEAPKEEKKN